jgi:hypothetical protein
VKKDPYSSLGLDQALFTNPAKAASQQADKLASQQASKPVSQQADKPASLASSKVSSRAAFQAAALESGIRETNTGPLADRPGSRGRRQVTSGAQVRSRSKDRKIGRFTYEIYLDQVRFMARLKLDLDEAYGVKLTNNSMVSLAIDALFRDYEINGDQSQLMRVLVNRLPLRIGKHADEKEEDG